MRHVSGSPIVGLLPILILVGTAFLGSTEQVLGQSPPSDGVKAEAEPATNDDGPAGESAVGTAESPEDRESAAISEAAEQAAVEAVLRESERWAQRLSDLIDGLGRWKRRRKTPTPFTPS